MEAPQEAAVPPASGILLSYWAGCGTETGQQSGALEVWEQRVGQQVALPLATSACLKEENKVKNKRTGRTCHHLQQQSFN